MHGVNQASLVGISLAAPQELARQRDAIERLYRLPQEGEGLTSAAEREQALAELARIERIQRRHRRRGHLH